jgi:hypothetical protein
VTTPAQAAARAENGRRHSTGPKSEAGKQVSRANALRHGIYARTVAVVPQGPLAEDPELHQAFSDGVHEYWSPFGPVEEELAQSIADLLWRGARVPLYEAALLANSAKAAEWEATSDCADAHDTAMAAAQAMLDLDQDHPVGVLEWAACMVGELVGIEMDDDWPQPRPADRLGWVRFIDDLLVGEGLSRADAATVMLHRAERDRGSQERASALRLSQTVAEAVGQDRLASLMRAEAHLTRELSRKLQMLMTLQRIRMQEAPM